MDIVLLPMFSFYVGVSFLFHTLLTAVLLFVLPCYIPRYAFAHFAFDRMLSFLLT